jgi:hypothetical protein
LERFGGEGREAFLNFMCLVHFFGGEGRGEEGSKIPHRLTFCFPPNWRDLEGRGGKVRFVIIILITLTKLSLILC